MLCLQTIYDSSVRRIDDTINNLVVDSANARLLVVSDSIESIPVSSSIYTLLNTKNNYAML